MNWNFLNRWLGFDIHAGAKERARARRLLRRRARPGLEQLEERQLLSRAEFCASHYRVPEKDTTVAVGVRLDAPQSEVVTVRYTTQDNTATAGQDYTASDGILQFAPGETMKMFAVAIKGDTQAEGSEYVRLTLNDPSNNVALGPNANINLELEEEPISPTLVPVLFPTGVDSQGALLDAGLADPHYRLVTSADPAYPGPAAVVTQADGWSA